MFRSIPNGKWLIPGVGLTAYAAVRVERLIWLDVYLCVGVLVACAFLVLHNPKPDPNQRFDIAICVPILAMMWPVIVLTLVLEKPWNSPEWKNRLELDAARSKDRDGLSSDSPSSAVDTDQPI